MSLFPRSFTQELSPLFRMVDDYAALARHFDGSGTGSGFPFGPAASNSGSSATSQLRSFQPRFDVSETEAGYTLHGELPGIDAMDVSIEWADGNTLTVSGRTERVSETGPASEEQTATGALEVEEASSETHSNYEKPTVEEESGQAASTAEGAEKPTSTEVAATNTEQHVSKEQRPPKPRLWVSERSVGQFQRSFSFPARVDQDRVTASLKNGVLEISVPKAAKTEKRRIEIQ